MNNLRLTVINETKQSYAISRVLMQKFIINHINDLVKTIIEKPLINQNHANNYYSLFFEKLEISSSSISDVEIYLAFALDQEMQKSCLGVWQKNSFEKPFEFWSRVCKEIKSYGIEIIDIPNYDEHYWLKEAMDKYFSYREPTLSP